MTIKTLNDRTFRTVKTRQSRQREMWMKTGFLENTEHRKVRLLFRCEQKQYKIRNDLCWQEHWKSIPAGNDLWQSMRCWLFVAQLRNTQTFSYPGSHIGNVVSGKAHKLNRVELVVRSEEQRNGTLHSKRTSLGAARVSIDLKSAKGKPNEKKSWDISCKFKQMLNEMKPMLTI